MCVSASQLNSLSVSIDAIPVLKKYSLPQLNKKTLILGLKMCLMRALIDADVLNSLFHSLSLSQSPYQVIFFLLPPPSEYHLGLSHKLVGNNANEHFS